MVVTRSKTTQSHIEDFATNNASRKPGARKRNSVGKATMTTEGSGSKPAPTKRKPADVSRKPAKKRTKAASATRTASSASEPEKDKIIINRAPVLQLWAASVTQLVYPNLSWETCLSAGSAISTICAVAKGRSIGKVPERDDADTKQQERDAAKTEQKELNRIEVMHFKLKVKDALVLVGDEQKGKPGSEEPLKKKFGEENYEIVRKQFEDSLNSWTGDEQTLNDRAFGFYEEFRPVVGQGQRGWGRKGELSLEKVKSTVDR